MRKIGMLVIAIVLALGALGVGYAYMTQDIHVSASVDTGYVQASFTNPVTEETFVDNMDGNTGGVAWYTTEVTNEGSPGGTLYVYLDNAYDGMYAELPITIRNTGSLPIGLISGTPVLTGMPASTVIKLNSASLPDGMAVGDSIDAYISIQVPWGDANTVFAQKNDSAYSFSMTITSTQFDPTTQYQFGSDTGVTAGTYGPGE